MALLTISYLLPNVGYISHNFGLFTSLNPTSNVKGQEWAKVGVSWIYANAGGLLSLVLIALMLASALRLARQGRGWLALPLLVLATAPFGILFAQNYGGEASLRVFLFSSPWRDVLIALGVATIASPRRRAAIGLLIALLLAALFVPAFYGSEDTKIIPRGEVAASGTSTHRAGRCDDDPRRRRLPNACRRPLRRHASGSRSAAAHGTGQRNGRLSAPPARRRPDPGDRPILQQYSRHGFLVFCETGYHYAAVHALTPPGALERLEGAVAASPRFRLWYASNDTRIYRLVS